MIVEAATLRQVRAVAEQMRERDREEFMAVSPFHSYGELVDGLVERYGHHNDVIVACRPLTASELESHSDPVMRHKPVAVGGLIHHRPNVASLLFFATEGLHIIGSDLTRFIRQRLFPAYRKNGTHRIECVSLDGYDEVHRWLEVLGLEQEARLSKFGRDGQDYVQFAWVGK